MKLAPLAGIVSVAAVLSCSPSPTGVDSTAGDDRPNLILLLADDMGYSDPSSFGGKAVQTPNLDLLAESGTKFTRFYSASAVCTPSRAAILTGRYPLRFDIRRHFTDDETHLPRGTVTLPKLLQAAGYATGHVGKWHLGGLHQKHIEDRARSIPGPHEHGFDHYQCQNEEQPLRGQMGRERTLYRQGGTCLIRDERIVTPGDQYYDRHFTDINGDEAVRLIEEFNKQGRPFFLNVWWLVPHKPYEPAPEPHWSRYEAPNISDDQRRFRSMVSHMDHKVGEIVAKLEELGIRDNTFIFFTSDNGGAFEADIGGYKGGKTDLHEGGIRVPAIASWPAKIPAGAISDTLGHHNDILPTFCEAAGVEVAEAAGVEVREPTGVEAAKPAGVGVLKPASVAVLKPEGVEVPEAAGVEAAKPAALDGVSLFAHLTDGKPVPDRGTLFWQMDLYEHLQRHYPKPKPYSTEIARRGKWKLLAIDGRPVELHDLDADPFERDNLLDTEPAIARQLTLELHEFLAAPRDRSGFPEK